MQVAVYARVSTERQSREQTIASQLTVLEQWVAQNHHTLMPNHIYKDEGWSGARLDRPGLDALRDGAALAEFKLVGVLSPDRLARKYAYQVLLLEELHRAGCEVVFLHHPISEDPNDQLLLEIQGAIAEYERAVLGERFRRGKLQKARAGQWVGGRAPYGFRYIPRQQELAPQLVVEENEAEIVRMVYDWLISEKLTIRQILKRLNAGPWLPRSGKHAWSASVVHRILSDPLYTGTAYINRYHFIPAKKPRTAHGPNTALNTCRQLRPQAEWIGISIPAIVDQLSYDLAQSQLARNALLSFRHNTKYSYLLRCLLNCKSCGLAMYGKTSPASATQPQRSYYECHGKDPILSARVSKCSQRRVRTEELDKVIWEHVRNLLEEPERLVSQYMQFAKLAVSGDAYQQAQSAKLEQQLKQLSREENRLVDAYQAEVISLAELSQRRQALTGRRQAISVQQEEQRRQIESFGQSQQVLSDLRTFSEHIRSRLRDSSFEEKQAILQLVIDRVIVGENSLEIRHVIPLRHPLNSSEVAGEEAGVGWAGNTFGTLCSDGVNDTALHPRFGKDRTDGLSEAIKSVHTGDEDIFHSPTLQITKDRQPELGPFPGAFAYPVTQHLAMAFQVDSQHVVNGDVLDFSLPSDVDEEGIQVNYGVNRLQRAVLPLAH
jgi:site-specific DNA recombinase